MARVAAGGRTGSALTAVLGPYLLSGATTQDLVLREVGVFNTTVNAAAVGLARQTAAGTAGTGLTEENVDFANHVTIGDAFNIGTGAFTVGGVMRQGSLGAAIGAGVIWTFGGRGLMIPASATLGVTIICPTGTGQVVDFYFDWEC